AGDSPVGGVGGLHAERPANHRGGATARLGDWRVFGNWQCGWRIMRARCGRAGGARPLAYCRLAADLTRLEVRAHAVDLAALGAPAVDRGVVRIASRIARLGTIALGAGRIVGGRRDVVDQARTFDDDIAVRVADASLRLRVARVDWSRPRGTADRHVSHVGGIHEDDASAAIDLRDANGHEAVLIGAGQIDVEHHHLTGLGVDQQILHGAEVASAHRADLPTAHVRFSLRNTPR